MLRPCKWWSDEHHRDDEPAALPKTSSMNEQLLRDFGLMETWRRSVSRLPQHDHAIDVLPESDFSTEEAIRTLVVEPSGRWNQFRRNCVDHSRTLQRKSYIIYLNAISISYLRRRTPHTEKAKAIFFRIWDGQADWMARNLGPRWSNSSLRTFSDLGRTKGGERLAGAVGFLYGNLIKAYEVELQTLVSGFEVPPAKRFVRPKIENLRAFQPGDDIIRNIKLFVIDKTAERTAGPALLALMAKIKSGEPIFQRVDDLATSTAPRTKDLYLSYGDVVKAEPSSSELNT